MKNRSHISFRREAMFRAEPHRLPFGAVDAGREAAVRREEVAAGCYVLHDVMSPKECRRLVEAAERIGFTHAGLAVGDDTYRVNLAARTNVRVVVDDPDTSAALWQRVRRHVDRRHEGAEVSGLNWRFRVYRYEPGQRFAPHYDVRTRLPTGETRFSFVVYLNDAFEGGVTRFFEEKDKSSRRGQGRGRKFDNRERFALRPPVGGAVVFDHLLLHEGSVVTAGVKYAVRSDVIYAAA
jgi:hypothetical protein